MKGPNSARHRVLLREYGCCQQCSINQVDINSCYQQGFCPTEGHIHYCPLQCWATGAMQSLFSVPLHLPLLANDGSPCLIARCPKRRSDGSARCIQHRAALLGTVSTLDHCTGLLAAGMNPLFSQSWGRDNA